MLANYSARLPSLELNNTFYRFPQIRALDNWRESAPVGFEYCLKAHRSLTYSAEGYDRLGAARNFGALVEVLGNRAGPILLQFPPSRPLDLGLLAGLLDTLARPAAVEFRHPSWFEPKTNLVLMEYGAALVVTDDEGWPKAPITPTGPIAYYRLRRDYVESDLVAWAEEIKPELEERDAVHVYFKHEAEGPMRALRLRELLGG
jgi:uncharacterized protein YecE (DUF72 family)